MAAGSARRWETALTQVGVCVAVGVVAGVLAVVFGARWVAPLIAWNAAALIYLGWTWWQIGRLDAAATAGRATTFDRTRRGSDLLLIMASLASLGAVGIVIVHAGHEHGGMKIAQTVLGVGSVVVAWLIVHTTFTLRYATLYHDGDPGGLNFNQDAAPRYSDFAYVAFTIGMTFQVSDTSFTDSRMRTVALRHSLLSYLFGTVIIATAINIVAGLVR